MTVGELKRKLEGYSDDLEVIIDIHDDQAINPRAYIKDIQEGFDWFFGELIICPDKKLTPLK